MRDAPPPPLSRALLAPRYVLSTVEVAMTFVSLSAIFGFGQHVLIVVGASLPPLFVLLLSQWVLEHRRQVRPIEALATRGLAGGLTGPERASLAEALVLFPRRVVYVRFMAWATTAAVLLVACAALIELSSADLLGIAGVCGANALFFLMIRAQWFRAAAERALWPALGAADFPRYLGRTVRERLFVAAFVPGLIGLVAAGLYEWRFLQLPAERVRWQFALLPPLLGVLAGLYARALFRATAEIRGHLAGRPLAGEGDGPFKLLDAHPDPGPLAALQAATSLPYRASAWTVAAWTVAGAALGAQHALLDGPVPEALLLFAGVFAVAVAAAIAQLTWSKSVLAPARDLCARELGAVPLDRLSPPVRVRVRFVVAVLAVVAVSGTFSFATLYLQNRALVAAAAGAEARARLEELWPQLRTVSAGALDRERKLAAIAAPRGDALALVAGGRIAWSSVPLEASSEELRELAAGRTEVTLLLSRATLALRPLPDGGAAAVLRPWPRLEGVWSIPALVLLVTLLTALAVGVALLAAREFVGPVKALSLFARRLGRGELDAPLPVPEPDELGELAITLDRMRTELRAQLAAVRELNLGLEQKVADRTAALERALAELTQAQAQLVHVEKMATVGGLAAGVAHEINNPLNFIANALGPLEATVADVRAVLAPAARGDWPGAEQERGRLRLDESLTELDELVRLMRTGVQRTQQIVGGLRDFSRRDEGEPPRDTDLAALVDQTVSLLAHELVGVEVVRDYEPAVRATCAPGAIGQVVMNLVANAAQALGGRGRLTLSLRRRAEVVVLEVRDSGPGIAPEALSKVFDPFFTTKPVGRGTGLGLSIAHGIVERHGGTVRVDSTPGAGATFTVELPAVARLHRAG